MNPFRIHRSTRPVVLVELLSLTLVSFALFSFAWVPPHLQASCGDLDCDGAVTASDALGTLKIAVGADVPTSCIAICPTGTSTTTTTTTLEPSGVGPGDLVVTEIMADTDAIPDQTGEWIEVVNVTDSAIDLRGLEIGDDGSDSHVISAPLPVLSLPGVAVVLGRSADMAANGSISVDYEYDGVVLGNGEDEVTIRAGGLLVDRVAYSAGFAVRGASRSLRPDATDAVSNDDLSLWCLAESEYAPGNSGSPGSGNPACVAGQ